MFNMNSPIVQRMVAELPPDGVGQFNIGDFRNAGAFYGNTPTLGAAGMQPQAFPQQMYPSPMEMATNNIGSIPMTQSANPYSSPYPNQFGMFNMNMPQNNMIPFGSQPMVNPIMSTGSQQIYNNLFNDYQNPYFTPQTNGSPFGNIPYPPTGMYGNTYNPFGGNMYGQPLFYGQPQQPRYQYDQQTLEAATFNGITPEEQIQSESAFYQTAAAICAKCNGYTEEQTKAAVNYYGIKTKGQNERPPKHQVLKKPLHPKLVCGDEVVFNSEGTVFGECTDFSICERDVEQAQRAEYISNVMEINKVIRHNQIYDAALERQADNMDLFTFFETVAPKLSMEMMMEKYQRQIRSGENMMYNRDKLRQYSRSLSLKNCQGRHIGIGKKLNILEQMCTDDGVIKGGYGYLPFGIPLEPDTDPEMGKCFSVVKGENGGTGIKIDTPQWMKDKIDADRAARNLPLFPNSRSSQLSQSRAAFINSLNEDFKKDFNEDNERLNGFRNSIHFEAEREKFYHPNKV